MVQIDRGNLANSLTSTITEDLNITTDQVNVGSQIFLVGVVIFELPSNILMQIVSLHGYFSPFQPISAFLTKISVLVSPSTLALRSDIYMGSYCNISIMDPELWKLSRNPFSPRLVRSRL